MLGQQEGRGNSDQSEPKQQVFRFTRAHQLAVLRNCQVGDALAKALLRTIDDHIGSSNASWRLSYEELAREMNCSVSTVRRREQYLIDRVLIDVEGPGPKKNYRITWTNLEETCDTPDLETRKTQADNFQLATEKCQVATENLLPENLTSYKRKEAPPPAPREDDWDEVVELLKSHGVEQYSIAIEKTKRRGLTAVDVFQIIEEFSDRRDDFANPPGALVARLTFLDGFPPASKEATARRAERIRDRQAIEATRQARDEAEKLLRRKQAAAARPKWDELDQAERLRRIEELHKQSPGVPRAMIERQAAFAYTTEREATRE